MEFDVFYKKVVGYKNILKGKPSQDYCEYKKIKNGIICALADGHSTEFFEYSDIGAKLACKAGIFILEEYINKNGYELNKIRDDLDKGLLQKNIYNKWIELVDNHFKNGIPIVFRTQYVKYSTTLVLVLLCDKFRIYFNIGDSTILIKNLDKYKKVLGNNNEYLVKSLGKKEAYKDIEYYIEELSENNKDDYIIIFSDGYSDGFESFKDMTNDLDETIRIYNKNVFSKLFITKNYKKHLEKITKEKSYDDISIMFIKSI